MKGRVRAKAHGRKGSLPWKVLARTLVVDTPWLQVAKERVRLPSGKELPDYYTIVGSRLVASMVVDSKENVLVVRQYRHAVRSKTVDLPGGAIEKGETALQAARRELKEETGVAISQPQRLLRYYPDSGKKGDIKVVFLFRLKGVGKRRKRLLSSEEGVEPAWIPVRVLLRQMRSGRFMEPTLELALSRYTLRRNQT